MRPNVFRPPRGTDRTRRLGSTSAGDGFVERGRQGIRFFRRSRLSGPPLRSKDISSSDASSSFRKNRFSSSWRGYIQNFRGRCQPTSGIRGRFFRKGGCPAPWRRHLSLAVKGDIFARLSHREEGGLTKKTLRIKWGHRTMKTLTARYPFSSNRPYGYFPGGAVGR